MTTTTKKIESPADNSTYPKVAVQWLINLCTSIKVYTWLTVLCSITRPNAKPESVSGNSIGDRADINATSK
jgi:hypothetical protein